jgi:DNA-binding NarL/FixJ family response regulator
MKILISDDSLLFRSSLKRMLQVLPGIIEISEAENYVSTIQKIESSQPDIIILDIRLPDESGFHVLDYIRDNNLKPYVIIATDYATKNNKEKGLEKGAREVFDKSHEFRKMIQLINEKLSPIKH